MRSFSSLRENLSQSILAPGNKEQVCDLLQIPLGELDASGLALEIGDIAENLKCSVSRPHAESQIAELFLISGLTLAELQTRALDTAFARDILKPLFTSGLVEEKLQLFRDLENKKVHIGPVTTEEQTKILAGLLSHWQRTMNKTIEEIYLTGLYSNQDLGPAISELTKNAELYDLPDICQIDNYLPYRTHFSSLSAVQNIFGFHTALEAFESRAAVILTEKAEAMTELFSEVIKRPGLLFFDRQKAGSSYREQLRTLAGDDPQVNSLITDLTQTVSRLLLVLESDYFDRQNEIRPDCTHRARYESFVRYLKFSTGTNTDLSESELSKLYDMTQLLIDADPVHGTQLANALVLDYPAACGTDDKLVVKLFTPRNSPRDILAHIGLTVSTTEEHPVNTIELSEELAKLIDNLAITDARTKKELQTEHALQAIQILSAAFPVFKIFTNISPELNHRAPVLFQFKDIWLTMTSLDDTFRIYGPESDYFNQIKNWLAAYKCQVCQKRQLNLSDLAGLSHFIDFAGRTDSNFVFPNKKFVDELFMHYHSRIKLLPSGLHALLSFLPYNGKKSFIYLLKFAGFTTDEPKFETIEFLQRADLKAVQKRLSSLLERNLDLKLSNLLAD